MKYICDECGREIPWEEYQGRNDILCFKCGGHIEEITEELASQTAANQFFDTRDTPTSTTKIKSYLISCESCSHQFSKRAESCPKCGWKPQVMCQVCQQKIPFDSTASPACGDPEPFQTQQTMASLGSSAGHFLNIKESNTNKFIWVGILLVTVIVQAIQSSFMFALGSTIPWFIAGLIFSPIWWGVTKKPWQWFNWLNAGSYIMLVLFVLSVIVKAYMSSKGIG